MQVTIDGVPYAPVCNSVSPAKKGNVSMSLDAEDKARYLMFKGALSEIPEDARTQIESMSERLLAIMSEDMDVGEPALILAMFKALEKR